jgi:hypothetical protein
VFEGDSENIVDEMDITEDDRDFNSSWDFILHRLSCWNFWSLVFNNKVDPIFWLLFSFVVIIPSIFFRTLDIFFIIGKKMRIHDSDFPAFIRKLYDVNYVSHKNPNM